VPGLIAAAGVLAMHYIVVSGMIMDGINMTMDSGYVAASVIVGVTACIAAFWILFR